MVSSFSLHVCCTTCIGRFRFHVCFFRSFSARVKWRSEATTKPSSTSPTACTQYCGTHRTAKSSTGTRARPSPRLNACPRRRRRGKNCRRRSSTVLRAVGTAPVERGCPPRLYIPRRWPTLESLPGLCSIWEGAE